MKKAARHFPIKGFTIIELFISIAIVAILAALSTPYLFGFREKQILQTERDKIINQLKIAQQKAISALQGYDYGLRFDQANNIYQPVLVDLQAESPTYQAETEPTPLPAGVKIDSLSNSTIVFKRLSGQPDSALTLTLSYKRFACQIEISSTGIISGSIVEKNEN